MKVCLGGTFNILHKGHKKLFDKAIEVAGEKGILYIGLTRGEVIKKKKNIKPFEERKNEIESYFSRQKKTPIIKIIQINSKYDQSLTYDDYDIIVVSPETIITAYEINRKRKELGNNLLEIVQIPFILADDGKPISSSRIFKKEIDIDGRILKNRLNSI